MQAARKRDAHEKIRLGGLVVKAGLDGQPTAVLLGGLIEIAKAVEDPAARERLRAIGDHAFAESPRSKVV